MAGKRKVYEEAMAMASNFSWDENWPDAVKAYRAALGEFPDDGPALAGLGAAYLELNQHESAMRALQRALRIDPSNQEAMIKMGATLEQMNRFDDAVKTYMHSGNLYAKAGQLDDAISAWEKAAQINPNLAQIRNNLAQAYARTGRSDEAVLELVMLAGIYQDQNDLQKAGQVLRGALQLNANSEEAQAALNVLQGGRSISAWLQEMQQVVTSEPVIEQVESPEEELFLDMFEEDEEEAGNPREKVTQLAMEELAGVLFEDANKYADQLSVSKPELDTYIGQAIDWQTRGNVEQTIAVYEQIIQAGFDHAATYFVLACQYLNQGNYDQAITYFNQSKQDRQYLTGANFALGEVYKAQGEINQALRYFVEVLKITDLDHTNHTSTAELESLYAALTDNYLSRGDNEATLRFVNSLIKFLSGRDWENKIARARQRLGVDDDTAVSAWIEFLEAGQAEVILSAMATTAEYMNQNMLMTAAEECYWAIQRAPNYLPLHMRLAEIYLKQERIEFSINKYLAVAEVYQIRDNMSQVATIYQRILKIAPMDVTVRHKLVELNTHLGNFDAALEHYRTLADAYYQLAQVNRALEIYQEALKLAPRASNPKQWQIMILNGMGDIYNQRVDWNNAAKIYERVIQLAPEDDTASLQLVDLYFKQGRREEAFKMLDRVMAVYNKQQKQTKMLQVLQDLVDLRPQELILHQKLAAFYVALGMKQQALAQYKVLGNIQLEAGLPDDAAHTIETIIKLEPDDVENYRQLLSQIRGGI